MKMRKTWLAALVTLLFAAACGLGPTEPGTPRAITNPKPKATSEEINQGELGKADTPETAQLEDRTADSADSEPTQSLSKYEIVTLLPKDAIPAIFDPQFISGEEADQQYAPQELVLGVEIDGDARAYSIPFLSGHEIVNDMVGGRSIAVTW
jgi:hypothetical protein